MPSNVIKQLAAEVLAATGSPQLPTVGRIVHYYTKSWSLEGPYAALVTGVTVISEDTTEIKAKVDLTVFGNDPHHMMVLYKDVPVGPPDGANLAHWWTWPARS